MVYCHNCKKQWTCPMRRTGPTVCGDFDCMDGAFAQHTIEDLPAEPLHDDDQEDKPSRA